MTPTRMSAAWPPSQHLSRVESARFRSRIATAIEPYNLTGLCDPANPICTAATSLTQAVSPPRRRAGRSKHYDKASQVIF